MTSIDKLQVIYHTLGNVRQTLLFILLLLEKRSLEPVCEIHNRLCDTLRHSAEKLDTEVIKKILDLVSDMKGIDMEIRAELKNKDCGNDIKLVLERLAEARSLIISPTALDRINEAYMILDRIRQAETA